MSTCNDVHDDLDEIVAGDSGAIARHSEHLASCDECRDLRHEAGELAGLVRKTGDDYVPPKDLAARVLAKIDAEAKPVVKAAPEPKVIEKKPADVTPIESKQPRKMPRTWLTLVAASAIAAGGIATYKMRHSKSDDSSTKTPVATKHDDGKSIGTTTLIARASTTAGTTGVSVRSASGDWRPLAKGEVIPTGGAVRTDERTRVSFDMKDGTTLILDHATEIAFDAKDARAMSLAKGRVVADVSHIEKHAAKITTPDGTIDVVGTKLIVTAAPKLLSVQVVRGEVVVTSNTSQRANVHAGEEAVIEGAAFNVASAPSLANELSWTELLPVAKPDETVTSGLGALRAYKPGEKRDRDWNLALAKHDVKVRISGPIARTEITETFRNDSDAQLEGVYQFPMPADAQIDGLELDVKDAPGGFLAGAFIDKSRAAKIWQGVIDKATPKMVERPQNEIIWVPGRWRDPALLDWKRGGRFELKIYPIPAKGTRTIKIAYTQVVNARGPFRQYVYPLAHSTDGSTVADNFTVDVEVRGAMPGLVRTLGYDMQRDPQRADVNALTMSASGFVPKGDITVDYRANDGDAELRAWTFAGGAAVAPDEKLAAKKGVGNDPKVTEAQRKVAADARPTAVLALRPNLPRSRETKPRDYMIVVDSSQSMVGERYTRASDLAVAMIGQMDRRDRFSVSACDTDCRTLGDLRAPSELSGKEAKAFLAETQPAGASDLVASIRKASDFASDEGRQKWVLFVGDGFATTGFRRAAQVEQALAEVAQKGVQVNTIGIGGDADTALLSAAARGGGGTHLAWTPGQTVQTVALTSIESTNGAQLRNATVELPSGLADVAPTILPTLRSGEEVLIAARIDGAVKGKVVLKGLVGNEPFTQEYPLELAVSSSPGNGFVPRLWASLAIAQLERRGIDDDRLQTIALSQGYGVMSRETSLLVLESQAMFDAFGVDRSQPANKWSGEDSLDEVVTTGSMDVGDTAVASVTTVPMPTTKATAGFDDSNTMALDEGKAGKKADRAASAPAKVEAKKEPTLAKPKAPAPMNNIGTTGMGNGTRSGGGMAPADSIGVGGMGRSGMIAMRRTWVRVPSVTPYDGVRDGLKKAIENAETALVANPDSREKHRALVQALSYAGELDHAREIAAKWLERDKLDPQALGYTADLLGRDGQRELALRTLAGLVDLDADRIALHERMIKAYETAGRLSQACSHRIAISAISPKDMNLAGAAIRCLRTVGRTNDAEIVRKGLVNDAQRSAAEKAATVAGVERKVAGDLVVNAKWQGNVDLDISLVTPSGERVSWMGGRTDAVVGDASSNEKEALALRNIKRGQYLIEITRGANSSGPITGTVDVSVLGSKRSLPFQLLGSHVTVSRLAINLEERWEQVSEDNGMVPVMPQARVNVGDAGDDVVNRVVRARSGMFRACYQRELSRDPSLQGRLDITIIVDATGRVTNAMAGGSMSGSVSSCIQNSVRMLRFPPEQTGTYRFPMMFNRS